MRGGLAAALALMLAAGAALPVRAAQTEKLSPAVSEGSSAPAQAEQPSGGPAELIEDVTEEPNEGPDEELSEDPAGELDENSAGNSAGGSTEEPAGETAEGPAADPAEAPAKGSAGEAEEGSPENSAEEPDKSAGEDPAEKPAGPPLLAAAARRGMIVSIEDTETLRVLPPVTVWADELEPLYRRMVELTRVRARAVSAEGGEQTLELAEKERAQKEAQLSATIADLQGQLEAQRSSGKDVLAQIAEARRAVAEQISPLATDIRGIGKTIAAELGTIDFGSLQTDLVARAQGYVQSGNLEDQEKERAFAEQLRQKDE